MAVVMTADTMGNVITLFDSSAGPLPIYGKKSTLELNQPGSFEFTLVIGHPAYQNLKEFVTYVKVIQDGDELFYGRVLSIQPSPMEGQEIVTCEGALSFLNDGELHKDEQNPNDSSAPEHQTMSAGAFLQRCLDAFNREIGDDPRRALGIGMVTHSKVSETKEYEVTSYIKVKNAIEQFLLDDYGGFIRVRPDGRGGHCLDWMEDTNQRNNAAIQLGENLIEAKHTISADGIFTAIRGIGNDDLKLSGSEVRDVYDPDQMHEYGRIVHTIQFDTDDQSELEDKVQDLIDSITKTSYFSSDIKLVDMHLIDGTRPSVKLGDQFTNIIGLEGIEMTVQTRTYDFDNPQNDSCTLKNSKEFDTDYSNKASSGSTGSSISGQTTSNAANSWKYYSEVGDAAIINAKNIQLLGELIELHGEQIVMTANEIVTLSQKSGDLEEDINTMWGTGVIQNSDMISQVAGIFGYGWRLVPQATLDKPGLNPSQEGYYNAHQVQADESFKNSGRELYATLEDILSGNRVDTSTIKPNAQGQWPFFYEMQESVDTEVVPLKNYYYRTLSVQRGTEIFMDESGQEVTVKGSILKLEGNVETIEGSALWTKRDFITGVVGEFDVVTDPDTGERTLIIQSGGGLKVERDGVALGVYDEGNLTGGMITDKLTDGTVVTKISGDIVNLNANSGYTQLVADKNGLQSTVQSHTSTLSSHNVRLGDIEYTVSNMTGSALWQSRNDITAVVGEFDVVTYGDGSRKLVVKSVGGLKIERNGVEYGLYDDGNLTAGVIVNKINGGTTKIEAKNIVLSGNTSLNDIFVVDGYGIHALRKFYGGNMELSGGLDAGSVELIGANGGVSYNLTALTLGSMIRTVAKNGSSLVLTRFDGTSETFSGATSLSGAWSSLNGKQYVVTASPQNVSFNLLLDTRLTGSAPYDEKFSAETGIVGNGGSFTVNSNLTARGYIEEIVNGVLSRVDVISSKTDSVIARIPTTETYNAGRNAVGLTAVEWNNVSQIGVSRTVTVRTTGKPVNDSASKILYLTNGDWSNGTRSVQLRDGGPTGEIMAEKVIGVSGLEVELYPNEVSQLSSNRTFNAKVVGTNTILAYKRLSLTSTEWSTTTRSMKVQLRDAVSGGEIYAEREVNVSPRAFNFVAEWRDTQLSEIGQGNELQIKIEGSTESFYHKYITIFQTRWNKGKCDIEVREGDYKAPIIAKLPIDTADSISDGSMDATMFDYETHWTYTGTGRTSNELVFSQEGADPVYDRSYYLKRVQIGLSATPWNNGSRKVQIYGGGSSNVAEMTIDAPSGSTGGYSYEAVWSNTPPNTSYENYLTFRETGTTKALASKSFMLLQGAWNNGSKKVTLYSGGETIAEVTINAQNAGGVYSYDVAWSDSSGANSYNTVLFRQTGTTSTLALENLYLTQTEWSGGSKKVQLRAQSHSGPVVAQATVTADVPVNLFEYEAVWSSTVGTRLNTIRFRQAGSQDDLLYKTIYLTNTTWSDESTKIQVRDGSSSGPILIEQTLNAPNGGYTNGYGQGYAMGHSVGESEGVTAGYAQGYSVGYGKGKSENRPSYTISSVGAGTANGQMVSTYLNGWNPQYIDIDLPGPQNGYYRCIWFKVDGVTRSFYFV